MIDISTGRSHEVSVLMSVYNCESTIAESVQSILNQDFVDFEFLIIDDCSTDNTLEIINSFDDSRLIVISNKVNKGLLENWNSLITEARGKYIIFQDGDDVSLNNRLSQLYRFMESEKHVAVCGANFIRKFPKYGEQIVSDYPTGYAEITSLFDIHKVAFIRGMFRKEVVEEMGKFRNYFARLGWEDYDLFIRISERYEVRNISDVLYVYNYFSNSSSKIDLRNVDYRKLYLNEIGFFLRHQRLLNNGRDSLSDQSLMPELELFLNGLKSEFNSDFSQLYRKKCINQISNRDYYGAFGNIFRALNENYLKFSNYLLFYRFTRSFLRSLFQKYIRHIVSY